VQTLLFITGLSLFLLGLLSGFLIPALKNPRMGLSSHLEGTLNGMFLVVLGLLWPWVQVTSGWEKAAVALVVYGSYANWLATLLAGWWGAGRGMMPIAGGEHAASAVKEFVIKFLLITLAVAIVGGVGIVLFGVART
jgi:hydroxylaminobenzene mutase